MKLLILLTLICSSSAFAVDGSKSPVKDFDVEIHKGNIENHSLVHKFGSNDAVGTSYVPLTSSGTYMTPTALTSLEMVSDDNTNDKAGQSGALTVKVWGINNTNGAWTEDSETVVLNGTTAVALTKQYYRIFRMRVMTSGTYGSTGGASHDSTITLRAAGAGATWSVIGTDGGLGFGTSEIGVYTVPKGYKAYLIEAHLYVDATKPASILMYKREGADTVSAPFAPMQVLQVFKNVTSSQDAGANAANTIIEGPADIGFMAKLSSGTGTVGVAFEIMLVAH